METKDKKQNENRFAYSNNEGLSVLSKEEYLSLFDKKKQSLLVVADAFKKGLLSKDVLLKAISKYGEYKHTEKIKVTRKDGTTYYREQSVGGGIINKETESKQYTAEDLQDLAKQTPETTLQNAIKQSGDEDVRNAAKEELNRRSEEEGVKTNDKKETENNKESKLKAENQFNNFDEYKDKFSKLESFKNKFPAFKNVPIKDFVSLIGDTPSEGMNIKDVHFESYGSTSDGTLKVSIVTDKFYYTRLLDYSNNKIASEMENNSLEVFEKSQGLGTKIFANQIEAAQKLGIERITCTAAKGDKKVNADGTKEQYNGYYTWAKLGYNISNPRQKIQFNELVSQSKDTDINKVNSLPELMSSDKGCNFWKENGFQFSAVFDLKKGSESLSKFNDYYENKFE